MNRLTASDTIVGIRRKRIFFERFQHRPLSILVGKIMGYGKS